MHAPCSNYRSILSSGSYYLEDFDYRSILVNSGIIVHWSMTRIQECVHECIWAKIGILLGHVDLVGLVGLWGIVMV